VYTGVKYLLLILFLLTTPAVAQQVPHPVGGPATSTLNEIAIFNNTSGNLLKQGVPAGITGDQTTGSTADGFQVQFKNQTSTDADAKYIWTCVIGTCNATDPGTFDHSRIITIVPPGSTTAVQTSQSVYFINETGRPGPPYAATPVYVGFNAIGICDADGAGCWGGNSNISDNRGQVPTSKPLRFLAGWEADFQVTSPNTWVSGFLTGGSSVTQPGNAHGYGCLWLDGEAHKGAVAKWTDCFGALDGSTTVFASIGAQAADGANTNSQLLNMFYRDASNARQNVSLAATPNGVTLGTTGVAVAGSFNIGTGAVFRAGDNGGLQIATHSVLVGSGASLGVGSDDAWTTVNLGNNTGTLNLFSGVGGISVPNLRPLKMGGPINMLPITAPAVPALGWYIYADSSDGFKLKAKASNGTTIVLGVP
jgi:hypothetical protein